MHTLPPRGHRSRDKTVSEPEVAKPNQINFGTDNVRGEKKKQPWGKHYTLHISAFFLKPPKSFYTFMYKTITIYLYKIIHNRIFLI